MRFYAGFQKMVPLIILALVLYQGMNIFSESKEMVQNKTTFIYLNGKKLDAAHRNPVYDILVDPEGQVFVPEFYGNRVAVFDAKGNLKRRITGVNSPHGIALDSSGNLYVAAYRTGRLHKFRHQDNAEELGWDKNTSSLDIGPTSLDFDASGNLYVADYRERRIIKMTPDGQVDQIIEVLVESGEEKIQPHGLSIWNGKIYIAERVQGVILVLTLDGKVLERWKPADRKFVPLTIRFAESCAVVANYADGGLNLFSSSGDFIEQVGSYGTNEGNFLYATSSFFDPSSKLLWVTEQRGNRIQRVELTLPDKCHMKE